jgi:hypothetical protein
MPDKSFYRHLLPTVTILVLLGCSNDDTSNDDSKSDSDSGDTTANNADTGSTASFQDTDSPRHGTDSATWQTIDTATLQESAGTGVFRVSYDFSYFGDEGPESGCEQVPLNTYIQVDIWEVPNNVGMVAESCLPEGTLEVDWLVEGRTYHYKVGVASFDGDWYQWQTGEFVYAGEDIEMDVHFATWPIDVTWTITRDGQALSCEEAGAEKIQLTCEYSSGEQQLTFVVPCTVTKLPILLDAGDYKLSALLGDSNDQGIASWEMPEMLSVPTGNTFTPVIPTIEFELPEKK